jgi:hypothetical protein
MGILSIKNYPFRMIGVGATTEAQKKQIFWVCLDTFSEIG